MTVGGHVGVQQEELEQADEIVGVPLLRSVRLAEPELPARRKPAEEGAVVDREPHRRAVAEPADVSAGRFHFECPALETCERAFEHRHRGALEEAALPRGRLCANAHERTLPSPCTNGGLWWNGTRLSQSRTACQWMSAVTCSGMSG